MENAFRASAHECDLYTFGFHEDGFLCAAAKDSPRTLEKQKACFELMKEVCNNEKVCLFLDMAPSKLIIYDEGVKEYMAQQMPLMFTAVAILAQSTLQKVGPTIFMNTSTTGIPIRLFDDEEAAITWLRQYL